MQTLSDDTHTYTIIDNDKPNIDFNTISSNGDESVSSADLTVDLSATYTENVSVDCVVTGTALDQVLITLWLMEHSQLLLVKKLELLQ